MNFLFSRTKKINVEQQQTTSIDMPNANLRCIIQAISETGPVRNHNEDHVLTYYFNDAADDVLCIVADGMGGHSAGEVASNIACQTIQSYLSNHVNEPIENAMNQAFQLAHKTIVQTGNENPAQKGMGTTATAVRIKNNQLYFAHVGDSRLYQVQHGQMQQLSKDHSLVYQMYEKGEISKDQLETHPMKNVLLQALGTAQSIETQVSATPINCSIKDKFLLCSDGLHGTFSDEQLADILNMNDPNFIIECLKTLATARHANDNFSAILITFSDEVFTASPITKEQNIMS